MKADLEIWLKFLGGYNRISVMIDQFWTSNEVIDLYPGSAGRRNKGFGIYFKGKWVHVQLPSDWEHKSLLSDITFLELFPVVVALHILAEYLVYKKIMFFIDNKLLLLFWTSNTLHRDMGLVRKLVLVLLQKNILLNARHLSSAEKSIVDALSRCNFQRFSPFGRRRSRNSRPSLADIAQVTRS